MDIIQIIIGGTGLLILIAWTFIDINFKDRLKVSLSRLLSGDDRTVNKFIVSVGIIGLIIFIIFGA